MVTVHFFVNMLIKLFFLLTPFFVMSMFLSMTKTFTQDKRKHIAIHTTLAIIVIAFILFYFGRVIFQLLGITIQSFQIGTGALLFITALTLVMGSEQRVLNESDDIAVIPLALPLAVGPGTTGTLLILGTEITGKDKIVASFALLTAILLVGILLLLATKIEKFIGAKGIHILTKLTGLVLAALAAQLIFTGIYTFPKS